MANLDPGTTVLQFKNHQLPLARIKKVRVCGPGVEQAHACPRTRVRAFVHACVHVRARKPTPHLEPHAPTPFPGRRL